MISSRRAPSHPANPHAAPDSSGKRAVAPATQVEFLYIHVPFCARKCDYCAFYSEAANADLTDRYVRALIRELELVAEDLAPRTVFFGGGTPTLLTLAQWDRVLTACHRCFRTRPREWTVECNPATLSADKARLLRDAGVNRISMGVQSLDDALLDRLGRVHTRDKVFRSFDALRRAGFDNVNLDLMFAIPGQTRAQWESTLSEALALGSEHLSCYEVIYEEDTPLFEQLNAGAFDADEDLACEMYATLQDHAAASGYLQYEVANFAKPHPAQPGPIPGHACAHNVNYWRGGAYYGLGPSASSYLRGVRTRNWANTRLYCEQLESGRRAIESREELPPLGRAGELAAFGLRMVIGWPFEDFKAATGYDLRAEWAQDMEALVACGWAACDEHSFRLTQHGLRFADAAAERFLRP